MTALPNVGLSVVFDLDADAITGLLTGDPCPSLPDRAQSRSAAQATTARQPVYTASNAAFGGHATLTFDGVDDFLEQTVALATTVNKRTLMFIGQVVTTSNGVWLDGTTATTDTQMYYSSSAASATSTFMGESRVDFGTRLTTPQVIIATYGVDGADTNNDASQNGGTKGTIQSSINAEHYDMLRIGAAHDLGSHKQIVVSRVVGWAGRVSSANWIVADSWVQDNYGITVADYAGSGGGPAPNVAPTAPAAFTSPAAAASVTGTALVSHGGSTDPDGDPITYAFELSTNGGTSWVSKHAALSTPYFDHDYSAETPTSTAKWRSRATDGLLTSAWTESGTFTIAAPVVEPALVTEVLCFDGVLREVVVEFFG